MHEIIKLGQIAWSIPRLTSHNLYNIEKMGSGFQKEIIVGAGYTKYVCLVEGWKIHPARLHSVIYGIAFIENIIPQNNTRPILILIKSILIKFCLFSLTQTYYEIYIVTNICYHFYFIFILR